MNRNGARSLSHSMSVGKPRCSFDATSASSCEYAASTDCSDVNDCGSSFSFMAMDMFVRCPWSVVRGPLLDVHRLNGPRTTDHAQNHTSTLIVSEPVSRSSWI